MSTAVSSMLQLPWSRTVLPITQLAVALMDAAAPSRNQASSSSSGGSASSNNSVHNPAVSYTIQDHTVNCDAEVKGAVTAIGDAIADAVKAVTCDDDYAGASCSFLQELRAAPDDSLRSLWRLLFVHLAWHVGNDRLHLEHDLAADADSSGGSCSSDSGSSRSSTRQQLEVLPRYHQQFLAAVGAPQATPVDTGEPAAVHLLIRFAQLAKYRSDGYIFQPAPTSGSSKSSSSSASSVQQNDSAGDLSMPSNSSASVSNHLSSASTCDDALVDAPAFNGRAFLLIERSSLEPWGLALPCQEALLLLLEVMLLDLPLICCPCIPASCCTVAVDSLLQGLGSSSSRAATQAADAMLQPMVRWLLPAFLESAAYAGCAGFRQQPGAEKAADIHTSCAKLFYCVMKHASGTGGIAVLPATFQQQPAAACRALEMVVRSAPAVLPAYAYRTCRAIVRLWTADAAEAQTQQPQWVMDAFGMGISFAKMGAAALTTAEVADVHHAVQSCSHATFCVGGLIHQLPKAKQQAAPRSSTAASSSSSSMAGGAHSSAACIIANSCCTSSSSSSSSSSYDSALLELLLHARCLHTAGLGFAAVGAAVRQEPAAPTSGADVVFTSRVSLGNMLAWGACVAECSQLLPVVQLPGGAGCKEACAAARQQLQQQLQQLQQEFDAAVEALVRTTAGHGGLGQGISTNSAAEVLLPAAAAPILQELGQQLVQFSEAVCAQLPVPYCCNNPNCSKLGSVSEQQLVAGRACVCARCRCARYCSRACQLAHHRAHRTVCKRISKELQPGVQE